MPGQNEPPSTTRTFLGLSLAAAAAVAVVFMAVGPIAQPLSYHDFADKRPCCGIPNCGDVVSNAGLSIVGAWGLWAMARRRSPVFVHGWERAAYWIFFGGVFLTGFGSSYYHWWPDNDTLVWDRLPMTLFFMPFFAATIGERISMPLGKRLLAPLVLIGLGSVLYWDYTEGRGQGDLRPYILVQFVPVVLVPVLLVTRPPTYTRTADLLRAIAWYVIAKLFEGLDKAIFALGEVVSGHSLKHLASAVASAYILRNVVLRERVTEG